MDPCPLLILCLPIDSIYSDGRCLGKGRAIINNRHLDIYIQGLASAASMEYMPIASRGLYSGFIQGKLPVFPVASDVRRLNMLQLAIPVGLHVPQAQ